jgi:kinesin family protein 1/kinesin family protein 3/17
MPEAEVTNVRVALRCRPLSKKELSEKDINVFSKEGNIAKLVDPENDKPVEFAFDHVYDDSSKQSEVFQDVGVPVVQSAFDGFNSTVFAYGQTGSGKSWSMTGDLSSESNQGLIPRINTAIFERIASETAANASRLFLVQCSYFEIYNEIIYDLLDPRNRKDKEKSGGLQVKEHPVLGIHVQGLQALVAENAAKIAELMDLGAKNRTVGSTQMNSESSRSHSVCLITVHHCVQIDHCFGTSRPNFEIL